jgi:hypothetical protein
VIDPFTIAFTNQLKATAVRSGPDSDVAGIAAALQFQKPAGFLMLAGGAGKVEDHVMKQLGPLFNALGETLTALRIMVIDGGTDAGVMALMGSALNRAGRSVDHIGIVPARADAGEGVLSEKYLEPHHTHYILVDSDRWGGETALMYRLAAYLSSGGLSSIALLANGGRIAQDEVEENVHQGREIIVIAGSGRLADDIAVAVRHPEHAQHRLSNLIRDG